MEKINQNDFQIFNKNINYETKIAHESDKNNISTNDEINQTKQTQKIDVFLANEALKFISPDELAQSVNLQRELKKLQFKNPGEAMIGNSKIKTNPQRPKRKVAVKTNILKDYKPFHDRYGNFITSFNTAINLCDCLNENCTGCHYPCRKCGSQKCSFQCRNNRSAIVEEIEIQGVKNLKNPFLKS